MGRASNMREQLIPNAKFKRSRTVPEQGIELSLNDSYHLDSPHVIIVIATSLDFVPISFLMSLNFVVVAFVFLYLSFIQTINMISDLLRRNLLSKAQAQCALFLSFRLIASRNLLSYEMVMRRDNLIMTI